MRRILSDRNMFSTLNSLANIKVFNKNSLLSTMFILRAYERVKEKLPNNKNIKSKKEIIDKVGRNYI